MVALHRPGSCPKRSTALCRFAGFSEIALRFPDLSASQNVALRFLDVSAFDSEALRIRLSALQQVALGLPDLSASHSAVLHFLDNSKVDDPESRDVTTSAPSALAHLIDFQVASALPPMGHSRFCLRYPDDCKVHGMTSAVATSR